jgi:hypothetical protein
MNLITTNNYEAYLLDYVEEKLSPELIAELMLFFENNPDLKEDLEDFEIHELVAPSIKLLDKSQLKKNYDLITRSNYEEFLIAEVEGLNTTDISDQLNLFLTKNASLNKELIAYQNTKLVAPEVIFDGKKALLQKERKVIPMYLWTSSAAAAILILVWFNGFNNDIERQYFPLAGTEDVIYIEDENEDLPDFYVFDDEKPQVAIVRKDNRKENKVEESKMNEVESLHSSTEAERNVLANVSHLENEIDTSGVKESRPKETEIEEEEILFAENSVKITYEDEILDDGTPAPQKKKLTKLEIIRKVIKQQVKAQVIDKGKDKILLAANSKPLSFIRGRKEK